MTLQTLVRPSPDQVSCDLKDQIAILNLKTGAYYGLDPVGAFVWKLIAERPSPVATLRDAVLGQFEVEPARCEADLLQLLEKLAEQGLIEATEMPAFGEMP